MTREAALVLDCSVIISMAFADERTLYAMQVADLLRTQRALVPPLFHYECCNVLVIQQRRKRLDEQTAQEALELIKALPIITAESPMPYEQKKLMELAVEAQLSAYDAAYLLLAKQHNLPLATLDTALQRAAQESGLYFTA